MLMKLPMHIFLNNNQSGAFIEYKKGRVFDILDKTKEQLKQLEIEEKEKAVQQKLLEKIKASLPKKEFKTKWHERYARLSSLKKKS